MGSCKRTKDKSPSLRIERREKSDKHLVSVWDYDDSLEWKEHELEECSRRMKRCEGEIRELKKRGTYVERSVNTHVYQSKDRTPAKRRRDSPHERKERSLTPEEKQSKRHHGDRYEKSDSDWEREEERRSRWHKEGATTT